MQRPPSGVWAALWSLPEFDDAAAAERLRTALRDAGHGDHVPASLGSPAL